MPVATSTIGDIADTAALQQSSIGQRDVALTPLQNAMVVAAIANGGEVMAPYLVKEIQSQELDPVETTEPDRLGQAIDPAVAQHADRADGQQREQLPGQRQDHRRADRGQDRHRRARGRPQDHAPHVWYVAFAPAEDPQVAVAVLVESGGDRSNLAATGGAVAAPIGRAVIGAGAAATAAGDRA